MPRKLSEERTRKEMKVPPHFCGIDPQLESAGWYLRDHSKVKTEIPVDGRLELLQTIVKFASVVACASCRVYRDIESLRGRMGESARQVEGLFESLLAEAFNA